MVFAERRDYHDGFLRLPGVAEYAHWNSTDHPHWVTPEQWAACEQAWDAACAASHPPGPG